MGLEFKNRERITLEEAQRAMGLGGYIRHILDNRDGTYSLMGHINCEFCDYCQLNNEWYGERKSEGLTYKEIEKLPYPIFPAKEDPYEEQKLYNPANYGPCEIRYMKLVESQEEFESLYPYKKSKCGNYPKRYPCLVNFEQSDSGLNGDSYILKIIYIPKGVDKNSFVKGVQADAAIFYE